jgi:hypothetical protein
MQRSFEQGGSARPLAITVICVIGLIGALFTIPVIFTSIPGQLHAWYPPLLIFNTVVGATCVVGLWKMRRWSVLTYTGLYVINQIILVAMDQWNLFAVVSPLAVIAIGFMYWSRMK